MARPAAGPPQARKPQPARGPRPRLYTTHARHSAFRAICHLNSFELGDDDLSRNSQSHGRRYRYRYRLSGVNLEPEPRYELRQLSTIQRSKVQQGTQTRSPHFEKYLPVS